MGSVETAAPTRNEHLTFRANVDSGRHGWLRLTPAYSHRLVHEAIDACDLGRPVVLDPFSGSGTTGVVAAERGLDVHLLDVNPFLVWLASAKTRNYHPRELTAAEEIGGRISAEGPIVDPEGLWQPALHRIERWWSRPELDALRVVRHLIGDAVVAEPVADLLLVALCRTLIAVSNAAFDHQSMSFADETAPAGDEAAVWSVWPIQVEAVLTAAREPLPGTANVVVGDARALPDDLAGRVDLLYTSPPYANRMSYVRELRPYMYWLGYLAEPRDAGELDWTSVGGTWGIATSRVGAWEPDGEPVLDGELQRTCAAIRASGGRNADLLARYVHKYAHDMRRHFTSAAEVLRPGGRAIYVVGNSTFFGQVVPVQDWYAALLAEAGFLDVEVAAIRKRNSNKALYEYTVAATRP